MAETSFFRLVTDERAEWAVPSGLRYDIQQGSLAEALHVLAGRPVQWLVPGELVVSYQLEMPVAARRQLEKLVPFALEERMPGNVEDMHFALGELRDGLLEVLVVRHQQMQQWLEQAASWGLNVAGLYADYSLLPPDTLLHDNDRVLMNGAQGRLSISADLAKQLSDLPPSSNESLLNLVVRNWSSVNALNLMQGVYKPAGKQNKTWQHWRLAAALAGIAVVLAIAYDGMRLTQMTHTRTQLQQQMTQVFQQAFPEVKRIIKPEVQMKQKLAELQQGGVASDSAFLNLLDHATAVIASQSGLHLQSLAYRGKVLELVLDADAFADLENAHAALAGKAGIQVELINASAEAEDIGGTLRIREAK